MKQQVVYLLLLLFPTILAFCRKRSKNRKKIREESKRLDLEGCHVIAYIPHIDLSTGGLNFFILEDVLTYPNTPFDYLEVVTDNPKKRNQPVI